MSYITCIYAVTQVQMRYEFSLYTNILVQTNAEGTEDRCWLDLDDKTYPNLSDSQ
jgi:hypothetical protein